MQNWSMVHCTWVFYEVVVVHHGTPLNEGHLFYKDTLSTVVLYLPLDVLLLLIF